jgi:hypothetical protein
MSDYNVTRDAAGKITDRFSNMLRELEDDYEEEVVVVSLMKYHALCSKPNKIDNTRGEYIDPDEDLLWAIERVLADYMTSADFNAWMLTVKNKTIK